MFVNNSSMQCTPLHRELTKKTQQIKIFTAAAQLPDPSWTFYYSSKAKVISKSLKPLHKILCCVEMLNESDRASN